MSTNDTERDERLRGILDLQKARARAQAGHIRTFSDADDRTPHERHIVTLDDEVARLDAVVTAVQAEHQPGGWQVDGPGALYRDCSTCDLPYPCPTVRALDGSAS